MTPQETILDGRVNVSRRISPTVVRPMVGSPPERTALSSGCTENSKQKLSQSRCFKRPVGKIPVIKSRNGKHSTDIEKKGDRDSRPTPTHPKDPQAHRMNTPKRDAPDPVNTLWLK